MLIFSLHSAAAAVDIAVAVVADVVVAVHAEAHAPQLEVADC